MQRKHTFLLAALALLAIWLLPNNAAYAANAPLTSTFFAAGSSAMFNTFGIAAGVPGIFGTAAYCGGHHWTASSSAGAALADPRGNGIVNEPGKIWVVWNDAAAAGTSGGTVCFYIAVDSIVGVRAYEAYNTLSLAGSLSGSADSSPDQVPLLGAGEPLNANVYGYINNALINCGMTDIRPEDAKFATMRVLTSLGVQVPGKAATGLGYGPFPVGTAILSSASKTNKANPVDFAIFGNDPINTTPYRPYAVASVGASPVMVIANVSNTGSGHLGDGLYTNVNRYNLANALIGKSIRIRDLAATQGEPDVPLTVFLREPLSGTYNTMEFNTLGSREQFQFNVLSPVPNPPPPAVPPVAQPIWGQEIGVNPSNTTCAGSQAAAPTFCGSTASGNPLWQIIPDSAGGSYYRGRAIGTSEMVADVYATPDSIGYAFWGFSNFQGKAVPSTGGTLKYLAVAGVDPLYSVSQSEWTGDYPPVHG